MCIYDLSGQPKLKQEKIFSIMSDVQCLLSDNGEIDRVSESGDVPLLTDIAEQQHENSIDDASTNDQAQDVAQAEVVEPPSTAVRRTARRSRRRSRRHRRSRAIGDNHFSLSLVDLPLVPADCIHLIDATLPVANLPPLRQLVCRNITESDY